MLNDKSKVCIGKACEADCSNCLNSIFGITDKVEYIKIWRKYCAEVLSFCKTVVVPDQSASDVLLMYYPEIENKLKVIGHGYDEIIEVCKEVNCSNEIVCYYEKILTEGFTYKASGWAYFDPDINPLDTIYLQVKNSSGKTGILSTTKVERPDVMMSSENNTVGFSCVIPAEYIDGAELELTVVLEHDNMSYYAMEKFVTPALPKMKKTGINVAFIGGLNKAKGGDIVADIIAEIKEDVNWHVFGGIGVKRLGKLKQKNLIKTGCYMPEDLPGLLREHDIDLIGIISIWPETYSYTLTEAILNGIPVIVADIGALGRRTKELQCGWTVPVDNIKAEFCAIIKSIIKDGTVLAQMKNTVTNVELPSISDMACNYERLYDESWNNECVYGGADYNMIYQAFCLDCDSNGDLTGDLQIYKQQLTELRKELDNIKRSASFRVVNKLWRMNIPGRSILRKLILK